MVPKRSGTEAALTIAWCLSHHIRYEPLSGAERGIEHLTHCCLWFARALGAGLPRRLCWTADIKCCSNTQWELKTSLCQECCASDAGGPERNDTQDDEMALIYACCGWQEGYCETQHSIQITQ